MNLNKIWKSLIVRRWHTNAEMSYTVDCTGGHSARMCLLAYKLRPDVVNKDFLMACLSHDMGEFKVGDIPYTFKVKYPEAWERIEKIEEYEVNQAGISFSINVVQILLLKLVDRLDSYLWVKLHRPDLVETDEWQAARKDMLGVAQSLGCQKGLMEAIDFGR